MLDGENPTREELIKYLDEEIARLEAEEQLANSQEIDDTKHSKQGAFLYEVDIIKTQHYEGFEFDLNGVLDGN